MDSELLIAQLRDIADETRCVKRAVHQLELKMEARFARHEVRVESRLTKLETSGRATAKIAVALSVLGPAVAGALIYLVR